MAIYTGRGDHLETDLLGGRRIFKNDPRVETYGTVDELISVLGLARCFAGSRASAGIEEIQRQLREIASELATPPGAGPKGRVFDVAAVKAMEAEMDRLEDSLFPLHGFLLPGPPPGAALLHQARTVSRRAERLLVGLARRETVNEALILYFNRVSDYLFLLARFERQEDMVRRAVIKVRQVLNGLRGEFSPEEGRNLSVSLLEAKRLIAAAEEKAAEIGVPMVIAVVDAGGNPVALHRMDGSLLASLDIAVNKAYSALSLRLPTDELGRLAQPGQPLYGIDRTNGGRIVIFGGGLPLFHEGRVAGGIGVSGGTVEQDLLVAGAAVKASPYRT
ncbi:MAG: cob(I)yrinic acid a,c-diamide adenosyltransferase [Desulfocucumaceae bacterium]